MATEPKKISAPELTLFRSHGSTGAILTALLQTLFKKCIVYEVLFVGGSEVKYEVNMFKIDQVPTKKNIIITRIV